uniref:Uncharacterized protein n=1 Tax=Rhodopseudomonas palustris (strain BisA53) TaxID=316055 RepID=Q07HP9_RHOP5
MTVIDPKEAASALSEIDSIARRVRQSRFYRISSLMLVLWGILTAVGYLTTYLAPAQGYSIWLVIYLLGLAGSFAVSAYDRKRVGVRSFDLRMLAAYLVFFGFGLLWSVGLGPFTPRQLGVFWPTYVMMVYVIVGLWVGPAFVAIGLSITALALAGYALAGDWFNLWMAAVNGGGLILGGLWMRRS